MEPTAALGAVLSVLGFAEARAPGIAAKITRELALELPPASPDARVAAALIPQVLATAARLTGDLSIGLHLAQAADPRRFGLLFYAASASRDLREAYSQVTRFLGLWNEGVELRFVAGDADAVLEVRPCGQTSEDGQRQLLELSTATLLGVSRCFTGCDFVPVEVSFMTPPPPDLARAELECYFGKVAYRRPTTHLVVDSSALALPLLGADVELTTILTRHAQELLERLATQASWRGRSYEVVLAELRHGGADVGTVARRLGVGARTLQRRLADDGTAFHAIVDEARLEMATRYLRDPALSQAEIAYLLGFAELSAYYHAFKRWTGTTPAQHRRKMAQANNSVSPSSKGTRGRDA
jgi:AraC-like DNA-binding protein